jgi:hypothetical protein
MGYFVNWPYKSKQMANFNNEFAGSDSKRRFEKQLKIMPSDWFWRTQPVTYSQNSDGYRCNEWPDINWSKSTVVLGCSHVFGIGVDDSHTITTQLQNLLSQPVVNLGLPAIGCGTITTILNLLLEKNWYPKSFVLLWSSLDRFEFYTDENAGIDGSLPIGNWWANDIKVGKLADYWNINGNCETHSINHIRYARTMCKLAKIPFIEGTYFAHTAEVLSIKKFDTVDYARDNFHPGPISHKSAAEWIAKQFFQLT